MTTIESTIREVEETLAILEEQVNDSAFIEVGGIMQIESEKIKLEALHEKADRSKGCESCNRNIYILEPSGGFSDNLVAIKKRFCPMCGRKLSEAQHEQK